MDRAEAVRYGAVAVVVVFLASVALSEVTVRVATATERRRPYGSETIGWDGPP
jgi:hypothetical protein